MSSNVPAFVNCRDRVSPLTELVCWLERAGCERIYLLDNDSAYEPLLDYYRETPHRVIRLGRNLGKFALWEARKVEPLIQREHFVYTDPDVVPDPGCPLDLFDRLRNLLDRYRGINKAGPGLRIDDIPGDYPHRAQVIAWERGYWEWPLKPGVFYAAIDTTMAMYRPGARPRPLEAARTGPPYLARHLPWYSDPSSPTAEDAFYEARAEEPERGAWQAPELPAEYAERIRRRGEQQPRRIDLLRWRVRGRRAVRLGL